MTEDDKTPTPEASRELSLAELNALVWRLVRRVKDLERKEIVDTLNTHERRLDAHEDLHTEHREQLAFHSHKVEALMDSLGLWMQGISRKADVTHEILGRIEARAGGPK